jgi:hypothetical protein
LTWSMFWIWSALVGNVGGGGTDWNAPSATATPVKARAPSAVTAAAADKIFARRRRGLIRVIEMTPSDHEK